VIIFVLVQFLFIKTIKPKFYKNIKNKTETSPNRLVLVWFGLVLDLFSLVRFGYFILKIKNYIVFWGVF